MNHCLKALFAVAMMLKLDMSRPMLSLIFFAATRLKYSSVYDRPLIIPMQMKC